MGAHEIPSTTVQSILESARRFGLSEAATWGAMDDALLAVGTDATVARVLRRARRKAGPPDPAQRAGGFPKRR